MTDRHRRAGMLLWWFPPLAVLLLLGSGLRAGVQRDCLDGSTRVPVGQTVQLAAVAPTWLRFATEPDGAYRAEVSGPGGSALELWTTHSDSGWCYVFSGELVERRVSGGGTESFGWGAGVDANALRISPPAGVGSADYAVALTELVAPPEPRPQVIPVVAHRAGVGGTLFRTDLELLTLGARPRQVELVLLRSAGEAEARSVVTLEPGRVLPLDDVLLSTFGLEDARGALLVEVDWGVAAFSSTWTDAVGGSFGQEVPAEPWNRAAGSGAEAGEARTLLHLAGAPDFRTNLGLVEVLGLDTEVSLELHDSSGATVASGAVTVPAHSHLQVDDLFGFLGVAAPERASLVVTVVGLGRVFTYASVIDNRSSDPLYVPGLADDAASTRLVVPAAASTDGAHGTRWRTDLWVLPRGSATSLEVTFHPSDGSLPTSGSFPLSSPSTLVLDDVVGRLGAHGSGALILEADDAVLASSRTYTLTAAGTYGQLIPPLGQHYYANDLRLGTILGVEGSDRWRTNVGLFNPRRRTVVDVRLSLVSAEGTLLGSRTFRLGPRRHLQVNDLFGALHVAGQPHCRVDVAVFGGEPYEGIYAYASVVDNRSGDPTYVPATPLGYELETAVELDNRRNSILLDQLPEAVGLDPLPAGTLTATVSGDGDLGRPDLPIQVLCLYKDPAGRLRSTVLPIGGSVADVGGGGRLWCVIPDWISTADNTGSVTVSLTDGDHNASLTLDARQNAVLLDQLEGPVVWSRPELETIRVATTGDLGRPELAPQVVAMYREEGSQRLRVRALVNGDLFGPLATDFQLLVAVVDWIDRNDNTGTTRLERACTTRASSCGGEVSGSLWLSDCASPFPVQEVGERILVAGEAGQVVTVTGTSEGYFFRLALFDPSGTAIAVSNYAGRDRAEIADVTLPVPGTYVLWALDEPYEGPLAYTVRIDCSGP